MIFLLYYYHQKLYFIKYFQNYHKILTDVFSVHFRIAVLDICFI